MKWKNHTDPKGKSQGYWGDESPNPVWEVEERAALCASVLTGKIHLSPPRWMVFACLCYLSFLLELN